MKLLFLLSALVVLSTAQQCTVCPSCVPVENPDFPTGEVGFTADACAAKVLFILDESGSLRNFRADVVAAATAFWTGLSALNGRGGSARLGLIEFATEARVVQPNLRTLDADYVNELNAYVNSQAGGINGYSPTGTTDWGEALKLANEQFTGDNTPDIVVFFTDGEPNGHDGVCEGTCYPFDQNNGDLGNACWEADKIKSRGIKIFTVAVGEVVGNVPAIQVISGGDVDSTPFGAGATEWDLSASSFGVADYVLDPNVENLVNVLTSLADALCVPPCTECAIFPTNNNPETMECTGRDAPTLLDITFTTNAAEGGQCGEPRLGQVISGFDGACRTGSITKTLAVLDECDQETDRTAEFTTQVRDTVGPTVQCPESVEAFGPCEDALVAITNLQVTATDLCSDVFIDKSEIRTITEEGVIRGYEVDFSAFDACENGAVNSCTVRYGCATGADIRLRKTTNVEDCAVSGDTENPFIYTLTVDNLGPSPAENVVVEETFPPGGEYDRVGEVTVSRGTVVETALGFTWTVGTLENGQVETATFRIQLRPSYPAGLIENTAEATTTSDDPDLCNNKDEEFARTCRISDLQVTKTDHQEIVTAGETIDGVPRVYAYEIEVFNHGPSDAANVRVVDVMPSGFLLGNELQCDGGSCFKTAEGFSCRIPNIPVGQRRVILATYTVPECSAAGPQTNTVHVASDSTDNNQENDHAHDVTVIRTEADIAVTKDDEVETVTAGSLSTYTYNIRVTNNGPSCAREVRVVDAWPLGLVRVPDTLTTSQGHCINLGGGSFSCNVGTLETGNTARIQASYTVPSSLATCEVRNVVNAMSSTYDPKTCNNDAKDVNAVQEQATLTITKTSDTSSLALGDTAVHSYTIVVTNNGPSTARQVTLTDQWPVYLTQFRETLLSSQGGCVTTGGDFTCAFGDIPAGQSVTTNIRYSLSELAQVGTFTNEAVAFSPTDTQCRVVAFQTEITAEKRKRSVDSSKDVTVDAKVTRGDSTTDIALVLTSKQVVTLENISLQVGKKALENFEANSCKRLTGAHLVGKPLRCVLTVKNEAIKDVRTASVVVVGAGQSNKQQIQF